MRWIAIVVMLAVACGSSKSDDVDKVKEQAVESRQRMLEAERARDEAQRQAKDAAEKVEKLQAELADQAKKIDDAMTALERAQNDADRQAARAKLDALRKQRAEIQKRLNGSKAQ